MMSSLQFRVTGLCVCLRNKYKSRVFVHKVVHSPKRSRKCSFFMTHRPLADAVFKKTIMSFLSCWLGRGLGLNHTVYCLKGRDGILNAILSFIFFPKERQASS